MHLYSFYTAGSTYVGFNPATCDNLFHKNYYRCAVIANNLSEAERKAQTLLDKYGNGTYLGTTFMRDDTTGFEDMQLLNDYESEKAYSELAEGDFSLAEAIEYLGTTIKDYRPLSVKNKKN